MISKTELEAIARIEERFPIGARVKFFPISGEPEHQVSIVRSYPWMLGYGAIVIKIEGRRGGVLTTPEHLHRIPGDEDTGFAALPEEVRETIDLAGTYSGDGALYTAAQRLSQAAAQMEVLAKRADAEVASLKLNEEGTS